MLPFFYIIFKSILTKINLHTSMGQLSFDINLNANGYMQGIEKCAKDTREYTNEVSKLTQDLPNLKKELNQATRQTMAMTLALSKMSEEQKNSAEGKALIRMLEETKEKAAELKDMANDTAEEIKNMSSDTRGLDMLKDAVSVAGNSFSALAGAIGLATGEEDKMKQAVVAFTTVQSTLNGITAVSNALEKQSALMTGITTLQKKAKTIATKLETAAQEGNIVATTGATIAMKAFNAVAAANPLGLLVTAIGAVVAAWAVFSSGTDDSANAVKNLDYEINVLKADLVTLGNIAQDTVTYLNKIGGARVDVLQTQLDAAYTKTNLAGDTYRRAFEEYNNYKGKDADTAEALYKRMTEAERIYEEQKQERNRLQAQINATTNASKYLQQNWETLKTSKQINAAITEFKALQEDTELGSAEWKAWQTKIDALNAKLPKTTGGGGGGHHGGRNNVNEGPKNSIEILEAKIKEFEAARKTLLDIEGNITDQEAFDTLTKNINEGKDVLKKMNDALNGTLPLLTKMKNDLSELEEKRLFAKTDEEITDINGKINNLKQDIEKEEIRLGIKVDPNVKQLEETKTKIADILNELKPKDKPLEGNFEGLDKTARAEADKALEEYNRIYNARQQLYAIINNPENGQDAINAATEAVNGLSAAYEEAKNKVIEYNAEAANRKNDIEQLNESAAAWGNYASILGSVSQATDKLGESQAAQWTQFMAQAAAQVAQVIQTILSLQAESMAKATAAGAGLTFPANIAAIAAGVAAVVNVFKSLPKFATGGIVSGSSYSGDNVLARLNSGERVLTKRQNDRLEDAIDYGTFGTGRLYGDVTVRGGDLKIAMRNYDDIHKKAR